MPPEPPAEPPAPPPPALPDVEGGNCPRCGAAYAPFQEYCLECGLRLPLPRGIVAALSTAWRRRIPWYPGDWIWPVLLALLIAALAAAGAIAFHRHGSEKSATKTHVNTTTPAPSTGTVEQPPGGTGTTGEPPPPPATGTETTPAVPPPPPATGELTEWPAGQNGWTVVLASIPQRPGARAAAVREARKAIQAGLTEVGVLNSSDYSSLHSGYFVVFSGIDTSLAAAKTDLETARGTYPQAYTRQIVQ